MVGATCVSLWVCLTSGWCYVCVIVGVFDEWYCVLLQVCAAVEAAVEDEVRLLQLSAIINVLSPVVHGCPLDQSFVLVLCCNSVNCVDIHAE